MKKSLLLSGIGMLLFPALILAQAGHLDPAFGQGGIVTTDIAGSGSAQAITIQADGKIVTAGSNYTAETSRDFVVVRYLPDGSMDTSFGNGGVVTTDFSGSRYTTYYDVAQDLAVQADGKIVVVGWTMINYYTYFSIARYESDGSLDSTFGNGGLLRHSPPICCVASAYSVALQDNGKILVGGQNSNYGGLVARYNSDGTVDRTFGKPISETLRSGYYVVPSNIRTVADIELGSSRIYLAGPAGAYPWDFAVMALTNNGDADLTFGSQGIALADFSSGDITTHDFPRRLAVNRTELGDDLVVGGFALDTAYPNNFEVAIARIDSVGNLDLSFGNGGLVTTDIGLESDQATGVAIQADGKVVASASGNSAFSVIRYQANGSLDLGFGTGGIATTLIGYSSVASAVDLQFDGKILVAGGAAHSSGGEADFAVARYLGISNPLQTLESLVGLTQDLLIEEQLSDGETKALQTSLRAALQLLDSSKVVAAINVLNAYVKKLDALVRAGILDEEEGQPLIDSTAALIVTLQAGDT